MKLIAVVAIFALLATCVKGQNEMVMKIMTTCKAEVGASDADIAAIASNAPPANKAQKCMFSCMMAAANVVKDGKLQQDGYTALANMVTGGDAGKMGKAAEIFDECKKLEGDADPCEAASKLGQCFVGKGAAAGIVFF